MSAHTRLPSHIRLYTHVRVHPRVRARSHTYAHTHTHIRSSMIMLACTLALAANRRLCEGSILHECMRGSLHWWCHLSTGCRFFSGAYDCFLYVRLFSYHSLVLSTFACFRSRLSAVSRLAPVQANKQAEEKRAGSWMVAGPAPLRQGLPPAGHVRSRRSRGVRVARAWSVVAAQDLLVPRASLDRLRLLLHALSA